MVKIAPTTTKSSYNSVGGDEIDSECRTEDEEYNQ